MGGVKVEDALTEYEKSIPMAVRKQITESCTRIRLRILREYYEDFNQQLKQYEDPTEVEAGIIERNQIYLEKINLRLRQTDNVQESN